MVNVFGAGFAWTMQILVWIAGAVTAVLLAALLCIVIMGVAGAAFDIATERIARRWEKKDKQPGHILGQIIMRRRRGKSDEI